MTKTPTENLYSELLNTPLPQRAKGIPHKNIGGPLVTVTFGSISCIVLYFIMLDRDNFLRMILSSFVVILLFLYLPEFFYDRRMRTKRYAFRKFPALRLATRRLRRVETSEVCSNDLPIINIDGRKMFLVSYVIRQKWWELQPHARLTGWALLNEQGQMIRSTTLFAKAFLTLMHAYTGGVQVQARDFRDTAVLVEEKERFIKRAEKLFHWQKKQFETAGGLASWQKATSCISSLYRAIEDAIKISVFRERVRKSTGYSFGLEYFYEDAMHTEKVYRAFVAYMKEKHFSNLVELNNIMADLHDLVKASRGWFFRNLTNKAILRIRDVSLLVIRWVNSYETDGISSESEWNAYVERLRFAVSSNFPVVSDGDFSEDYPFNGALFHSDVL